MIEKTTPCEKCKNPECEFAGRLVYVLVCQHEYVAPPQTRADRVRAMTDEELAEWIETLAHCERCPMMGKECKGGCSVSRATCKLYWIDWLKQEAKENKEMALTQTLEEGR